jgi:hypothetical protein
MGLKKGVFFSIVSIFIVILFVASTELISEFSVKESEMEVTRTRVKLLNSMINDFETVYFDKLIYVSAKNSLVGLSEYYFDHNFEESYMKNLGAALSDTIYEGVYLNRYNTRVNLTKLGYIDYDYTFNGLVENITQTYEKLGLEIIELTVNFTEINSIQQIDPWTLRVNAEISYHFSDKSHIASWKGDTIREVDIPVIGIYSEDSHGHDGVITNLWNVDHSPWTEVSVLNKLSGSNFKGGGLCSPDFDAGNGRNCTND